MFLIFILLSFSFVIITFNRWHWKWTSDLESGWCGCCPVVFGESCLLAALVSLCFPFPTPYFTVLSLPNRQCFLLDSEGQKGDCDPQQLACWPGSRYFPHSWFYSETLSLSELIRKTWSSQPHTHRILLCSHVLPEFMVPQKALRAHVTPPHSALS